MAEGVHVMVDQKTESNRSHGLGIISRDHEPVGDMSLWIGPPAPGHSVELCGATG